MGEVNWDMGKQTSNRKSHMKGQKKTSQDDCGKMRKGVGVMN